MVSVQSFLAIHLHAILKRKHILMLFSHALQKPNLGILASTSPFIAMQAKHPLQACCVVLPENCKCYLRIHFAAVVSSLAEITDKDQTRYIHSPILTKDVVVIKGNGP
jgi:hypothetical protein